MRFLDRIGPRYRTTLLLALFCLVLPLPLRAQSAPSQPSPEIRALLEKGQAEETQGHREEAARLYAQALQAARDHTDRSGEAAALVRLGTPLLSQAPPQAIPYFEQALALYRELKDRLGQALCLLNLGNGANLTSQPQKALEYYEAARQLYQAEGVKTGQAAALNGLGAIYRMTGQPVKARDYLLPALEIYQKAGDKPKTLRVLSNIGAAYGEAQDMAHAQETFAKALTLAREIGSKPEEGLLLSNLATVQGRLGNARQALEDYTQALPLLEAAGDRNAVANCYGNMATLYEQEGDLLDALAYTQRALEQHQELGNQASVARDLDRLGTFTTDIGQLQTGLEYYQQALERNRDTGDIFARMMILNNMGRAYGKLEQPQRERECYEQSLRLQEQAEHKQSKAFTLYLLSGALMVAGESRQALASCEAARALFHEGSDSEGEASAELQLGQFQAQLGAFVEARQHYANALKLYRNNDDVGGEAMTLTQIGALEEQQRRPAAAEPNYTRALALLEGSRESLGRLAEAKVSYLEQQLPVYRRYLRFLLQNGQNARAFAWAQKAKARALIDLMEAGHVQAAQAMTPADRQQEERLKRRDKELSQQWLAARGELDELRQQARPDRSRLQKAERQTQAVRQQQQQCERDWRAFHESLYLRNPRLAQQRSARTVTLAEAAACLPADTALLEYSVLNAGRSKGEPEEIALFVVTQQTGRPRLNVYRVKSAGGAISRQARTFRDACAGRPDTPAERPYKDLARQLYHLLIAPAETALAGKRRLILCPDGPLWDVPFQALLMTPPAASARRSAKQTPSPAFLWERYEIVYAVSATGMKAALDARQRPNRPKASQALLVMANPDFGTGDRRPEAASRTAGMLPEDSAARALYTR
ncbi:MAG TPA: tetratricopeptide repeat protein, partial [Chthonomonadaceae bacterium]|nr:tetratricopeptide repeat protein [Chthonomonadaceae bacterium]